MHKSEAEDPRVIVRLINESLKRNWHGGGRSFDVAHRSSIMHGMGRSFFWALTTHHPRTRRLTTPASPSSFPMTHRLIKEGSTRTGLLQGIEYNGWTITSRKGPICNSNEMDK